MLAGRCARRDFESPSNGGGCTRRWEGGSPHLATRETVGLLPQDGYDCTTVYRIPMDLTERGLAHRRILGDHVWRFDLRGMDTGRD